MSDLTLFDQLEPAEPTSSAPDSAPRRTPLEQLRATVERQAELHSVRDLHPRDDKLWIVRNGGAYFLSVRKGKEQYRLGEWAVRQLAGMLDVPAPLLQRLSAMPRVEDCRLLNMLMFAEGARPDARFRFVLNDGRVTAVHSGKFTSLNPLSLVEQIERLDEEGRVRVRRFEARAGDLWLELEHTGVATVDLSPVFDRANAKADIWRPGAILWNQEDGTSAVTIVPVLFREWGGLALPVVASRADIRKRRHVQESADALLRAVTGDLAATREAPFDSVSERLRSLHERFLPAGGVFSHLDSLSLPFPSKATMEGVVRRVTGGRPTQYRLAAAALHEARGVEDHARRLRLLLAVGRMVWTSGRSRKRSKKN